jgi:hypothetical protein
MRCTVCSFPQVTELDLLLATGTSIRKASQLYGLARSTVARHRVHIAAASAPFALIHGQGDPHGTPDPLSEAFLLAERARTPRERIRALEQIRSATKLRLRGASDLDAEDHELLDSNIRSAEAAFRDAPEFETAARALSGWRESDPAALGRREHTRRHPHAVPLGLHRRGREPFGARRSATRATDVLDAACGLLPGNTSALPRPRSLPRRANDPSRVERARASGPKGLRGRIRCARLGEGCHQCLGPH